MGAPRLVHEQLAHQRVDVVAELVGGLQLLGAPWERPAECRDDGLDEAVREVPAPTNNDTQMAVFTAVFRPLRTVLRGRGAGFLSLGGKTEGTAKNGGKNGGNGKKNGREINGLIAGLT